MVEGCFCCMQFPLRFLIYSQMYNTVPVLYFYSNASFTHLVVLLIKGRVTEQVLLKSMMGNINNLIFTSSHIGGSDMPCVTYLVL